MQKINLARALPKQHQLHCNIKTLLSALAVIVVIMLLLYFWQQRQSALLQEQIKDLRAQQVELSQQIVAYAKTHPGVIIDRDVRQLMEKIEHKERVLNILTTRPNMNTTGFSRYLYQLARDVLPGVWLTDFKIAQGGASITVNGRAYHAQTVFDYLKALNTQQIFVATPLSLTEMTQPAKSKTPLTFELVSKKGGAS